MSRIGARWGSMGKVKWDGRNGKKVIRWDGEHGQVG